VVQRNGEDFLIFMGRQFHCRPFSFSWPSKPKTPYRAGQGRRGLVLHGLAFTPGQVRYVTPLPILRRRWFLRVA